MKRYFTRLIVIVITLVVVALLAAASAGAARKSARLRTAAVTEQGGQPVSGNSYHEVLNGLFTAGGR